MYQNFVTHVVYIALAGSNGYVNIYTGELQLTNQVLG